MPKHPFTQKVIEAIRAIPKGRVSSYGRIARMAGNPRAARQVARILHACSRDEELPWQRVVNHEGRISLPGGHGEEQRRLLEAEGVKLSENGCVDLEHYLWSPDQEKAEGRG